jgi:hypothetical protein
MPVFFYFTNYKKIDIKYYLINLIIDNKKMLKKICCCFGNDEQDNINNERVCLITNYNDAYIKVSFNKDNQIPNPGETAPFIAIISKLNCYDHLNEYIVTEPETKPIRDGKYIRYKLDYRCKKTHANRHKFTFSIYQAESNINTLTVRKASKHTVMDYVDWRLLRDSFIQIGFMATLENPYGK